MSIIEPNPSSPRRGVVAVVRCDGRFLVIRRSRHVVAPLKFCFPGGGIEGDETEEQALEREFSEELGAAIRPLRCCRRSTTRWNVQLAWWQAEIQPPGELIANPAEVESIHWLTPAEMLAESELLESNRDFLAALDAREFVLD
jgi:8-oxo-dGTP diphosphatase